MPLAEKGVRGKGRQPLSPPQRSSGRSAQSSELHPLKTHRTVHPRTPIETVAPCLYIR